MNNALHCSDNNLAYPRHLFLMRHQRRWRPPHHRVLPHLLCPSRGVAQFFINDVDPTTRGMFPANWAGMQLQMVNFKTMNGTNEGCDPS